MTLGSYIKDERLKKGLALREFCRAVNMDYANWSKIERNKMKPYIDDTIISKISKILNLSKEKLQAMKSIDCVKLPYHEPIGVLDRLPIFVPIEIAKDEKKLRAIVAILEQN